MNIYTAKFDGYYPVGAVALVVAENQHVALLKLNEKLDSMGFEKVKIADLKLQDTTTTRVDVLLDGNY